MKSFVLVALFASLALTGCLVPPGPPGHVGITVSPLPPVVLLGADPYYYQDGYYYYYQDNYWRYSQSRNGPWADLPRSHWPGEVRYEGRDDGRDRGRDDNRDRGRGDDRGRDSRPEYDRR